MQLVVFSNGRGLTRQWGGRRNLWVPSFTSKPARPLPSVPQHSKAPFESSMTTARRCENYITQPGPSQFPRTYPPTLVNCEKALTSCKTFGYLPQRGISQDG